MLNNPGILLQIRSNYNQLTNTERKVADFVLESPEQILYMSISDLADACGVGDTSVYRFCRTMHLQGYQAFKMQLSLCLAAKEGKENEPDLREGEKSFAEQIMHIHMNAIRESYMLLNMEEVDKIVDMICEARRVFFFGIGDSLLTAEEARNKFLRITGKVACITDPHMQSMAAATSTEEDLIIIISYSGATKDNIHVAKEAKKAGAKIASITHFKKSPLTTYSDAVLLCGAKESPLDGGSVAAKMGQLYLIDLIYQEYEKKNYRQCRQNQERTTKAVVEKLF